MSSLSGPTWSFSFFTASLFGYRSFFFLSEFPSFSGSSPLFGIFRVALLFICQGAARQSIHYRERRRRDLNPRAGFIQPTPLAGEPLRPLGYFCRFLIYFSIRQEIWRREWDSNPRTLARRRFSRPVPSTTRTSLHKKAPSLEHG